MSEPSEIHRDMLLHALLAEPEVLATYQGSAWFKSSLDTFAAMLPSMVRGLAEEAERLDVKMRFLVEEMTRTRMTPATLGTIRRTLGMDDA